MVRVSEQPIIREAGKVELLQIRSCGLGSSEHLHMRGQRFASVPEFVGALYTD